MTALADLLKPSDRQRLLERLAELGTLDALGVALLADDCRGAAVSAKLQQEQEQAEKEPQDGRT